MRLEVDTIKIEMTPGEAQQLKEEIISILNQHPIATEEQFRIEFPKINEVIKILQADLETIPF